MPQTNPKYTALHAVASRASRPSHVARASPAPSGGAVARLAWLMAGAPAGLCPTEVLAMQRATAAVLAQRERYRTARVASASAYAHALAIGLSASVASQIAGDVRLRETGWLPPAK